MWWRKLLKEEGMLGGRSRKKVEGPGGEPSPLGGRFPRRNNVIKFRSFGPNVLALTPDQKHLATIFNV